ncbi:MAG: dephospho-CoA kinase [Actinobacteria bacterium]|uniref:Unannotated protein n=1 Tax=freshwater metagenome TaxID=449393 RepID=A0A6J7CXA6_9ZZZZ|nr:dephospho-CoA kinase [Actinomycetota bacterium]MSW47915.1 dephospho-CoA kinase [Actinomycetota bacterium]MSX24658.1 dephospho-CoA kinase [Actinomycetota bacterium]MSY57415.1 dephospho-CoA kinase [Actinomycetota bacterium]MTA99997.1 dephospho-CoA kinase [Actinomycetota bacterium]
MVVVGLTGGIGSGKSMVGELFARLGAVVVDADQLARESIDRGTDGFDQVVSFFGDSVLSNGAIDRRVLAERVFADATARRKLESIIHPIVRSQFLQAVDALHGEEVLVYEIPLLVESRAEGLFDFIISVECEISIRYERLRARGMSSNEIDSRIASQATAEERAAIADLVITNNGTQEELLREVERIWESILPALQRAKG